ncbi:MAG TPA: sialidase family protein [Gammaproteobacteria bacterium]|nr:sialidase family protein [Gammaproteobacteria bacterium]
MKPRILRFCLNLLIALGGAALYGCADPDPAAFADVRTLPSPAGAGSGQPHLGVTPDGRALLSWLEEAEPGTYALRYSFLDGQIWSAPREIARSAHWFVNWADFPSVEAWEGSRMTAHWLAKRPGGTYSYDVVIAQSDDSGKSWSAPFTPHRDGTPTEHGFVSLFSWRNALGALWLDGREMTGSGHAAHGSAGGAMTLRAALLAPDGGTTDEWLIDDRVCDCCQTDTAATTEGIVAVYRNRSADEVRDISAVRFDGRTWSEPGLIAEDGWRIAGCPVNGPAVAARDRRVGAAWFTAAGGKSRVYFASSDDAGRSFSEPVQVDAAAPLGRVDVVLSEHGAIVSWLARPGRGGAEIRLRRIDADGNAGEIQVLASTSAARSSGFPQMISLGDRLVLAWTEAAEPSRLRTAALLLVDAD